uniref:Uncharacterized protein n=1 Tax=Arundo donax TaxID=35708 RepID=A0A0A9C1H7_ARUDO
MGLLLGKISHHRVRGYGGVLLSPIPINPWVI